MDNYELLRGFRHLIKARTEPYDPAKHLPIEWQKKLEGYNLDGSVSIADQEAIKKGEAYLDEKGYVVYRTSPVYEAEEMEWEDIDKLFTG